VRSHTNYLSLITATLLLLQPPGTILGISSVMATTKQQLPREQLEFAGVTNLPEELEKLQQILATQRKKGHRSGEADTLNKMAGIYTDFEQYSQALELHQQALKIYQELNEYQSEAETIGYMGNTYFKAGEYRQVEELFRQELESIRKISEPPDGNSQKEQLILEVMRSYLENAWYFQAGLGYSVQDSLLEKKLSKGDISWQERLEITKLNLFIDREFADLRAEAHSLHGMGWVYRNLGQYSRALEFYQQALTLSREIAPLDIPLILQLPYATEIRQRPGVKVKQEDLDKFHEAFLLVEIGLVYSDLNQDEKALQFFQLSLPIAETISNKYIKERVLNFALNKIGLAYSKLGQYQQSLQFFEQALSKQEEYLFEKYDILNNIGSAYLEMGNYSRAREYYQEALKFSQNLTGDPGANGFILNNIASVYTKLGDYSQALQTYRQALALFRELKDFPGERTTFSNIGALLEKQNKPELAIVFYKEAVNITEAIRQDLNTLTIEEQKAYTATVADTYRRLADLLLSQGRILEAQQVLELLKVQELRNFTKDTRAGSEETTSITTNPTEAQILSTHGSLIALGRKIEQCQQCQQRSQLLDQREVISKEFEENVRSLQQIIRTRLEKDQAFLDPTHLGGNAEAIVSAQPGTVLIYPLVLEDKLWILWAAEGGITKSIEVPQVGLKELSQTVVNFRQLLQNPNSDLAELQATGKLLYDWLIPESLQREITENQMQNLVFSLDHVTRYIPLGAVFDGENYLIENYNISTIISANLTRISDRLPPGTDHTSVLALGLSEAKSGFNPLPNVPAEIDAIVRQSANDPQGIYPGLELLNQAFDYKALRDNLATHLILHIATHGEFVANNAYASYLLLGDGKQLPIQDIQNLRDLSKIHLVVLSACETALGDTGQDGTEIAGLSYYFLNGGAKAVMASLWQVDDGSTSLLMQRFYSNLAQGTVTTPITKAQALRQAQLSLLKGEEITTQNTEQRANIGIELRPGSSTNPTAASFAHPYYWAPFILIGNGF